MMELAEHLKMPMAQYLALPALSQGPLAKVIDECPQAAWFDSYLNPNREQDDPTTEQDIGTVCHAIVLEQNQEIVEFVDRTQFPGERGGIPVGWTTKAMKDERERIRAAGRIPMLADNEARVMNAVKAAWGFIERLRTSEPAIYAAFHDKGDSEVVTTWDDDGVPCKIRMDRVNADRDVIIDLKFTEQSVDPVRWARSQLVNMGYYFGAGFYRRGCRALNGTDAEYLWMNVCTRPPHLVSICGMNPAVKELARAKVDVALRKFRHCLQGGHWPAYANRVYYLDLPAWEVARFEEQQIETGTVL